MLKAARFEIERRRVSLPHLRGGDLDDLAHQSAPPISRLRPTKVATTVSPAVTVTSYVPSLPSRCRSTAVATSTRGQQQASAAPVPASASAAPNLPPQQQPSAPTQPSPLSSSTGAQSFPLEDSQPGREPPQGTKR